MSYSDIPKKYFTHSWVKSGHIQGFLRLSCRMFARTHPFKHLLWWLLSGTRGGTNRAQIILALREMPRNANQLAEVLQLDYKTVRHHLGVLQKNRVITLAGERYGTTYFLTAEMEANFKLFEEIWERIGRREKKDGRSGS